jgi:hypothetical protein
MHTHTHTHTVTGEVWIGWGKGIGVRHARARCDTMGDAKPMTSPVSEWIALDRSHVVHFARVVLTV